MKKNLIALLIVALVSVGLFADPITSTFNVKTSVKSINEMKLTVAALASPYPTTLENETGFSAPVVINSSGVTVAFTAYISALSNNQAGFTVTMSATPMSTTSTTNGNPHLIDYTVDAGGITYKTRSTIDPVTVIDETTDGLTALTGVSKALSISVDTATFNAAIEDNYEGTVTFTYTAK